ASESLTSSGRRGGPEVRLRNSRSAFETVRNSEAFMHRALVVACVVLAAAVSSSTTAAAQSGAALSGRLLNALSGEPIPAATVLIEELRRTATSAADGIFTFDNVPAGTYHLSVRSDGYSSRRTEVTVPLSTPL